MTGSSFPRPIKYDAVVGKLRKFGQYGLIAGAILMLPDTFIFDAILFMVGAFIYWAISNTRHLPAVERRIFLKTAIRAPKFQKLGFYLLTLWLLKNLQNYLPSLTWGWYFRWPANPPSHLATEYQLVVIPLTSFLLLAPLNYIAAAVLSLLSSTILKKKLQLWTDLSLSFFNVAYLASLFLFAFGEAGGWLTNWLISSGRDANFSMDNYTCFSIDVFNNYCAVHKPESLHFELIVKSVFAIALYMFSAAKANQLSVLLVSAMKRAKTHTLKELLEAPIAPLLDAMRQKRSKMKLSENNLWLKHTSASFWWICACYATLFWFFGFMDGPMGKCIADWFTSSFNDAGFPNLQADKFPALRWFCGSIVALYGTIPLAITGPNFLPFLKRKEIIINEDGIYLPDGPRISLQLISFKVWADFKSVDLVTSKATDFRKRSIRITFHSGGSLCLKVSQLSTADMHNLLASIDEKTANCSVSDDILALTEVLASEETKSADNHELRNRSAENYMSTVFVPLQTGDYIKGRAARVVRLLASKPLSAVYLARDAKGKFVIVKQFYLAEDTKETQALRKIFERECEILQKLNHPRISRVVDHFQDACSSFLILEHARGTDLRSYVQDRGKLSESTVLKYALQLAEIMRHLHEQDAPIVHRDLTPDNIVIADDGMLQLIDFGAAHQFLEGITGTMIGKQCYTSPEQLRGNASTRSDIYSFACTLYFLLTGEDPVALSQCDTSGKAAISKQLDQLLKKCTEFEETERVQTFSELIYQIKAIQTKSADLPCAELQGHLVGPAGSRCSQGDDAERDLNDWDKQFAAINGNREAAVNGNREAAAFSTMLAEANEDHKQLNGRVAPCATVDTESPVIINLEKEVEQLQ